MAQNAAIESDSDAESPHSKSFDKQNLAIRRQRPESLLAGSRGDKGRGDAWSSNATICSSWSAISRTPVIAGTTSS